ncbi:caspase family protein [Streptomyces sp. HD]|uniref:caspase family protein n=1 Tax=Streptomyces sp. HD TaxID=3020892 RepID=UPI00232EBDCD|nr:caspase family protein [Streptomyces sp. HD]MDC0771719.1 caspase family protein [Streptomyces sp. HD]
MELADPSRSRAVLVGIDDYRHLSALPSVPRTVTALADLLSAPDLFGLRQPDHCRILSDLSSDAILDAVHDAATEAEDTFVFYFAGHGLISHSGDLLLALPNSDHGRLYRALPYEEVRRLVVEECNAQRKVVILDCCYSARALTGYLGPTPDAADLTDIEGAYVMTSSGATKISLAPEDEPYTSFTGELIRAVSQGIPDGPELLTMDTLYRHVRAELRAKNWPDPHQRIRNSGDSIALFRNRAQISRPEPHIPAPDPDSPGPVHFYFLVDRALAMADHGVLAATNFAIRELIPELQSISRSNPGIGLKFGVISFAEVASWHVRMTPIDQFAYQDLKIGNSRFSDLGGALGLVSNELAHPHFPAFCPPPVIAVMLAGTPKYNWVQGLQRLDMTPWGPHTVRLAIPVTENAGRADLIEFLANSEHRLLQANSPRRVAAAIRWMPRTVFDGRRLPSET